MRADRCAPGDELRDGISREWYTWLAGHGLFPVLLPNVPALVRQYYDAVRPGLLILSGGNDVIPAAQGGGSFDEQRQETERAAIDLARERGIGILGVCRGFQLLNQYFGGTVVAAAADAALTPHVAVRHALRLTPAHARRAGLAGATSNSYHAYCVTRATLAPGLDPVAECEADGSVESFVHPDGRVLAVHWHPERAGNDRGLDEAVVGPWINQMVHIL